MKVLLSTVSLVLFAGALAACSSGGSAQPAPAPGSAGASTQPTYSAPAAPAPKGAACGAGGKACG